MKPARFGFLVVLRPALLLLVAAVAWKALVAQDASPVAISLTSPAFGNDGAIPDVHTCTGQDVSPPLAWGELPAGTRSLVFILDDPDAPDPAAPQRTWVHWVLYNIPPSATGLPAGVAARDLPVGTGQGLNDWKRTGYGGPCPPIGRHRYFHKLYALDTVLPDLGTPTKAALEKAMQGHILGQGQLVGTYQKP
ncbi:MAG: phospholipid-binding protein, family [Rhodocyclaceae bacterium]|nr:phospholipid-binding protein, family [Rhodocyclaceae bacterium]